MLMQGRLFAEHAAYMAARVGSVQHGSCQAMTDAAILALLPSFTSYLGEGTPGATPGAKLATAWRERRNNRYSPVLDNQSRDIVWLYRPSPLYSALNMTAADHNPQHRFDHPDTNGYTLEVRAVYWYPLRIPFANWVMAAMYRGYLGLSAYNKVNPLMPVQTANDWNRSVAPSLAAFGSEYEARYNAKEYAFPVVGTAAMRMMTPPRASNFLRQNCDPAP